MTQIGDALNHSIDGSFLNKAIRYQEEKYKTLEEALKKFETPNFSKLEYIIPKLPDYVEEFD